MTFLQQYLDELKHPVFLAGDDKNIIRFSNKFARNKAGIDSLVDKRLDVLLKQYPHEINGKHYASFANQWYEFNEKKLVENSELCHLIELKPRTDLPSDQLYESWKHMVEVMLHRLRSPLTGVTGYLELLEEEIDGPSIQKRFDSINKGFDHIFEIMDELEALYQLDPVFDDTNFTDIPLKTCIDEVTSTFPEEDQKRINTEEIDKNTVLFTDPEPLRHILRLIIHNGIRHSNYSVQVSTNTENPITVTFINKAGELSPEILKKAFFPFVTTRADDLGIGLTSAVIYGKKIGATLFFEQDGEDIIVRLLVPDHHL